MSVLATQATEIFPLVIALKALFATLAPLNGKATERKEFFSPGQCLLHLWCNENCKVVARTIAWCNRFSKMPLTFSIYSNIKDTDIFVLGIKSWRQNKIYIYCWAVSRVKLVCFVVFFFYQSRVLLTFHFQNPLWIMKELHTNIIQILKINNCM